MVGGSQIRSFDLLRQFSQTVVSVFNRRESPVTQPTDGPILKMHYKYTFWLTMAGFAAIWYSWLHRDVIVCVSHFNADLQVRLDYLNICLSFPYITNEDGSKQFLLYYRWVHWVLFLVAFAFYLPHKIAKGGDNIKLNKLVEYLASGMGHYEGYEFQMVDSVARFFAINMRTQDKIYYRYLFSNVFALFINIVVFFSLDALLLNNFASLGYEAYPYVRDGQFLSDHLTKVFPPFADCQISTEQMLINKRTEKFGCHLTAMEFYEKLFLAIWFWLIALMIITSFYILFLCCFLIPSARKYILRCAKPYIAEEKLTTTIERAGKNFRIGDWFLLYKLKFAFSDVGYYRLLQLFSEQDYMKSIVSAVRKELPSQSERISDYSPKNKGILVE